MDICAEKTKLLTKNVNGLREIKIKGLMLRTVTSFKYLGAIVSDEGSKPEVPSRTRQATTTLTKLSQLEEITTYLLNQR